MKTSPHGPHNPLARAAGRSTLAARRGADRFLADLLGAPAGRSALAFLDADLAGAEGNGDRAGGAIGIGPGGREPFLDDSPDERWSMVLAPGAASALVALRPDDVVVWRAPRGRPPAWTFARVADVDRRRLVGPDGVVRDDVAVLRRAFAAPIPLERRVPHPGRGSAGASFEGAPLRGEPAVADPGSDE